jgi:carbon storage regulator CsrA
MSGLSLGRFEGESILIGESVEVVVESVGRGKCQLKVIAPRHVPIVRKEIAGRPIKLRLASRDLESPKPAA